MLHKFKLIALPSIKFIKELLSKCSQDANLKTFFDKLSPEQRLINIFFEEVELTQAMRFTSGHVLGHANKVSDASKMEELATHTLVIEIVCYHGGPRYILRVIPVAKLNAGDLEGILLESSQVVVDAGGCPIFLICNNCPAIQGVCDRLGGPDKLYFECLRRYMKIRNNWITIVNQQFSFEKNGV